MIAGVLNNAVIKIEDNNFEIKQEEVKSQYVKNIDGNTINLNTITYGRNVEINIPVKFSKNNMINIGELNKETTVSLSGIYIDKDERKAEVKGQVKIRLMWTDEANINVSQDVEKYIALNEKETLLQQEIEVQVEDNKLPFQSECLEINVPVIKQVKPSKVKVLVDGNNLPNENYQYGKEDGVLKITNSNLPNEENKIEWEKGKNEYKIIYIYDEIGVDTVEVDLQAKIRTKLYTRDEEIENELQDIKSVEQKGDVVSTNIESSKEIYKGYLYANTENETTYKERVTLEISEANSVDNVIIETEENNFIDVDQNLNNASTNTYYKEIKINKQKMQEILGKNGSIEVSSKQGAQIAIINGESETNDQGEIIITIDGNETNEIVITTSKPEKEGSLQIEFGKAIKSDEYVKEQLKSFVDLEEELKVTTNISSNSEEVSENEEIQEEELESNTEENIIESRTEQNVIKTAINMNDTKTDAKLSLSTKTLSTLSKNENLIINTKLLSCNPSYDLFKNPYLEIYFPEGTENIEINSVNVLYVNEEDMGIENYEVREQDGRKVICVTLQGEQREFVSKANQGIQVVINANIEMNKKTPSKIDKIEMKYTNENGNEAEYWTDKEINLESKYGMFVYNSLKDYRDEEIIDNINNDEIEGRLDTGTEEKIAKVNTLLVNNYLEPVDNIAIIGNLNTEDSNIDVKLADKIELENAKVYYATENTNEKDSENWQQEVENIEEVKAYKIELENLNQEGNTELNYELKIPGDLEYNQKSLSNIEVLYDYEEKEQNTNTKINLSTITAKIDDQEQTIDTENLNKQEVEGIGNVYVKSTYADSVLENGQSVYQGQSIKNTIVVENTTEEELTNINVTAMQSNANFFITERVSEEESEVGIATEYTSENTEITENNLDAIEALKPGETATIEYQYVIKEDAEGETLGTLKITADDKEEQEVQISKNSIEDGDLKLILTYSYNEIVDLYSGGIVRLKLSTKNISEENKQNVILEMHIPNITALDEKNVYSEDVEVIENENGIVKFKINEIDAKQEVYIPLFLSITELDSETQEDFCRIFYQVTENDKTYTSNEINKKVNNVNAKLEIEQTGSSKEKSLKNGEELVYTAKIRNVSVIDKEFEISDSVPKAAVIQEAYVVVEDEKMPIEEINENNISITRQIKAKSEITLVIRTKIDTSKATSYLLKNTVYLVGSAQTEQSNTIEYTLDFQPTQKELENNIENQISGTAWVDKNKDGKKETSEEKISGMEVQLVDTNTEEIVTDENGNKIKTTTDENGDYELTGMANGEYIVVFKYDTAKYIPTEYKRQDLSFSQNSDVIQSELNGEVVATTDVIVFSNNIYGYIDAGFKENFEFDLKLDKYISKVIVQTEKGTGVKEYNKEQLAKIEIPAQYLEGTTVLVQYQIDITNEGEIEGYANEIIDYMPKDMTFSSELNKDWYMGADGNLHTVALTNDIIKPEETKTITLILTKTMTKNNTGTSTNIAEIANISNSLSITDIDSSAGNYADEEDDISTAEILISISTGALQITLYVLIAIIVLVGTGYEVYKIKVRKEG